MPGSDQLLAAANQVVRTVAGAFGADVADAFAAMNHAAGSPAEKAFVCSRTWECTPYQNIHPTDLGYRQLAIALLHAAG
jgi:lysophospholipase L1-like esterase